MNRGWRPMALTFWYRHTVHLPVGEVGRRSGRVGREACHWQSGNQVISTKAKLACQDAELWRMQSLTIQALVSPPRPLARPTLPEGG